MTMTEEQIAARLAEVNAMEARVMAASNREDAIGAEITRLMNERDEARAEALDAPSGAPCLRCGGGAYAVACPLCSPAGDR